MQTTVSVFKTQKHKTNHMIIVLTMIAIATITMTPSNDDQQLPRIAPYPPSIHVGGSEIFAGDATACSPITQNRHRFMFRRKP